MQIIYKMTKENPIRPMTRGSKPADITSLLARLWKNLRPAVALPSNLKVAVLVGKLAGILLLAELVSESAKAVPLAA
jgi:hypothetical protein